MPPINSLNKEVIVAKGFRSPSLQARLQDADGDAWHIPSGSSAAFRMVSMASRAVVVNDAAAVIEQQDGDEETDGRIRYDWAANDVATAGRYWGFFVITLASGRTQLWPPEKSLIIDIK